MCQYKRGRSSGNATLAPATKASDDYKKGDVCGKKPTAACEARFKQLHYIHDQAHKQWENVDKDGRTKVNSVIFNVFIWCQVNTTAAVCLISRSTVCATLSTALVKS